MERASVAASEHVPPSDFGISVWQAVSDLQGRILGRRRIPDLLWPLPLHSHSHSRRHDWPVDWLGTVFLSRWLAVGESFATGLLGTRRHHGSQSIDQEFDRGRFSMRDYLCVPSARGRLASHSKNATRFEHLGVSSYRGSLACSRCAAKSSCWPG